MTGREGGTGLYSTLVEVKFPDIKRFSPETFDWLFEDDSSRELLDWISSHVTSSNYLEDEEINAFNDINKGELLSGSLLEAALETAADKEAELSTEELERRIAVLEAEIGWHEESLQTVSLLKKRTAEKTQLESLSLGSLKSVCEGQVREERRRQEQVLQFNNTFNTALHTLRSSLEGLVHELVRPRGGREDQVLQCRLHLGRLEEQEGELDQELGLLITDLFGARFSELGIGAVQQVDPRRDGVGGGLVDLDSASCLELVRGRDRDEFLHLKSEINRLRVGIFRTEIQRIQTSAKEAGVTAALGALKRSLSGSWSQLHPSSAASASSSSSSSSSSLSRSGPAKPNLAIHEPETKLNQQIANLVAECVGCYCEQVLTTDYTLKYRRSLYIINKVKIIRDMLLTRRARQEILDLVLLAETEHIINLVDTIKNLEINLETRLRRRDGFRTTVSELGTEQGGNLILPRDPTFSNLHRILRVSGLVDPIATYTGVEAAVAGLVQEQTQLRTRVRSNLRTRLLNLDHTETELRALAAGLHIDVGAVLKPPAMVPRDISRGISSLDRGIRELELKLKRLLTEWDRHKTELKTKPYSRLQRGLWIDFLLKPQLLSANVRAVQNKVKD